MKRKYHKAQELWCNDYQPLTWNGKPIFLDTGAYRFRDVYVYNREHQAFYLVGAIDTRQGIEKGLELMLDCEVEDETQR